MGSALLTSKCLIGIWSPLYFQSKYCVSEWQTFLKREELYNRELIIPASYHDGQHFPSAARDSQFDDFSNFTSIMARFWETDRAVEFDLRKLKAFAKDAAILIRNAPPFDDHFPLIEVDEEDVCPEHNIERIANF